MIRRLHVTSILRRVLWGLALYCTGAAGSSHASAAGEPRVATDEVLRVWGLEDGMADHHVSSITRGRDGYLWLTTFSGLARFDGVRFDRMGRDEVQGLPTPWVAPVFAARDGTVWLGLDRGGVYRWAHGDIARVILPVQPRSAHAYWPTSFAEDRAGDVWIGSGHEAKVFRWHAGELTTLAQAEGVPAGSRAWVVASARGDIWCFNHGGCAHFDGERFQRIDIGPGAPDRLAACSTGGMWAAGDGHLFKYSDDGARASVAELPLTTAGVTVSHLLEDRDGQVWIGTWGDGLLRYRDGRVERVPTSFDLISALTQDDQGNLWVGTWGGGLDRLTPRHLFLHEADKSGAASITADAAGRCWILDRHGVPEVSRPANGSPWDFSPVAGWPTDSYARVVAADVAGDVWIGTDTGLVRWHGGGFSAEPFHERVAALLDDGQGGWWIGTEAGDTYHRGPDGYRPLQGEPPVREVRTMARDAEGRLWFGTQDGSVFLNDKGSISRVPLPGAGGDETVRTIVPDGDNVWIGTLLGGLYRWRAGQVLRLPPDPSLPLAELRALSIRSADGRRATGDAGDTFWFGTAQGLFSTTRSEVERRLAHEAPAIAAQRYSHNEGLPNLEFVDGGAGGVPPNPDGPLWFATNQGALEVRPAPPSHTPGPRRVVIGAATLGEQPLPVGGAAPWRLPPRPGTLHIRYTLPELVEPEGVRFRHRLVHFGDEPWSPPTPDREAVFAGLAAGPYHFEVEASVGTGPWLQDGAAELEFSVRPVWWQTTPFRLLALVLLGAAVWAGAMLRVRVRIRRAEQAQALDRERTRIARDMHDELGASLTHIAATSSLALLDPPEEGAAHFREIAQTARQSVESLDEIVWAVNPRYDSLAGTVEYLGKHAVRFLSGSGLACEVDLPDELPDIAVPADVRHHLLLVTKEALTNALKHSRGSKLWLHISIGPDVLRIVVQDDGVGFEPPPSHADPVSNGLRNMRERMRAVGGRLTIDRREGGGCSVIAELPMRLPAPPRHGKSSDDPADSTEHTT